jgi:(R)-2-hydroxyacyl-CoA dehydratese activating ATPase
MITAGLDVGSRSIELVVLDGRILAERVADTGVNPLCRCRDLLAGLQYDRLVVTGYGRQLVAGELGGDVVSEITAHAVGARHLYPDCRTVIDVGGQDTKVCSIGPDGRVQKFEMNDRCAAGTGKFLEVMADTLEVDLPGLGPLALGASHSVSINSLCTVFAGSEVVSLIARGEERCSIARGVHEAIADRLVAMARRVGIRDRVVFSGGGALKPCLAQLLSQRLGVGITVPNSPQSVGALGAAIVAVG